jgi:multidrug efflux pump subunit AcrA (membrane-fusion protein)
MKRKPLLIIVGIIITAIVLWLIFRPGTSESELITSTVKQGDFEIKVTVTGELEAKNSENISGPSGLRMVGIWGDIKITDMIPEGTVVDSGDWVATLDKTEISSKLKDLESELEKFETQLIKTKLDTTLELRNARDELVNLKYSYEEQQITLEQSKYEPPATQRQAKIELDKRQRSYDQAVKNYKLKLRQAEANVQEQETILNQAKRKYENMMKVLEQYTVFAPKPGMVIYRRNWRGQKQGIGSTVSPWNNTVAKLPDLTTMISKTYVNEIDISRIQEGQTVKIGVDAFPEKAFTGVVAEVANIGEQLNNTDAKVFEVMIQINEFDSILRPAMTTKNEIITGIFKDVKYIPLEAIHNADSVTYVFKKKGGRVIKQQVITGKSNENEIILRAGLDENDEVLLNIPEGAEDLKLNELKLTKEEIKELEEKEKKKEETPKTKVDKSDLKKRDRSGNSMENVIIISE